jgi:glyoxylate reductase
MATPARLKVAVALALTQVLLDRLADYDLAMVALEGFDEKHFETVLADADGVLISSNVPVNRHVISAAPRLRVISTMSVGLDHIDLPAARERGITVTNTPVLADAVADLTLVLMTMLSRRIAEAMRAVTDGRWNVPLGGDLAGKVLLLVGFGRIGQAVARRALAAGMRVTYVDVRGDLRTTDGVENAGALHDALGEADFVSLHVDLNQQTRHLMGRTEFSLMKPSAFLVNTSRGGVVDQSALAWALTNGEIAGAGLDVLEEEPPAPNEPLLSMANVIVVPHIGSATTETRNAMARCAVDNLVMVLRQEGDPFVVG